MNNQYLIPTAEPFYFIGGEIGCLLVHGFTGAPKEMRGLGEYLHQRGYSVLGIRLFGHATQPDDMNRARWQDWIANVEDGWNLLSNAILSQGKNPQIFIIGLSIGGILSLIFASDRIATQYPLAGVVSISTPYELVNDWRLHFIKPLSKIQPYVPKGKPDWRDPTVAKIHIDYPAYPSRSIAELFDLVKLMQRVLPNVHTPVLILHAHGDNGNGFFDPNSAQNIYTNLASTDKEIIWVENSGHNIPMDYARIKAFQAIEEFIARVCRESE